MSIIPSFLQVKQYSAILSPGNPNIGLLLLHIIHFLCFISIIPSFLQLKQYSAILSSRNPKLGVIFLHIIHLKDIYLKIINENIIFL